MKNLIILVGFIFIISCASDGDQSVVDNDTRSAYKGPRLYKNAHIVDRPSSPFIGGFNKFTE
ncbi:hypothetical protein MNBD_NITROSPINAE03-137 [hydrothermal vent metagenome]|uniref:Uncharacterized protein n=1 Tax=hydrothermal vent metagenome TaxID=652676 RepID=A0A3B1BYQ6_9ZZZZ